MDEMQIIGETIVPFCGKDEGMKIEFRNVTGKAKGNKKDFVLKDISFTAEDGFLTGITGKNGAGKTTLFHYIMDEGAEYEGTILVGDKVLADNFREIMNEVGFISDEQIFFFEKSAMENVNMLWPLYDSFSIKTFKEAMAEMGVSKGRKVGEMSRGEYLKFQLAFALAHESKVYLLDEVTAGMDPIFRKEFFKILHKILENEDVAILMSTHIEEEIEYQMDFVGVMEKGRMISFEEAKIV